MMMMMGILLLLLRMVVMMMMTLSLIPIIIYSLPMLVAYNVIPIELPKLDIETNLIGKFTLHWILFVLLLLHFTVLICVFFGLLSTNII